MTRSELIEKLEGLSGPDREVDAAIGVLVGAHEERERSGEIAPQYTGSLDDAVALVARVVPALPRADHQKSEIGLQIGDFGCAACIRRDTFNVDDAFFVASAPTPAIALCLATLKALESRT